MRLKVRKATKNTEIKFRNYPETNTSFQKIFRNRLGHRRLAAIRDNAGRVGGAAPLAVGSAGEL
jgi:hypothetical protein